MNLALHGSKVARSRGKVPSLRQETPRFMQRVESSSVLELKGCRIRWQGSKVTRLQESKVAGFHSFKTPRFQCSGVAGFQSRNPFLEPLQERLAGSLAGTFPDAIAKLADSV